MNDIPKRFQEYHDAKELKSFAEMMVWLKMIEPEYEDILMTFEVHMDKINGGEYPYPKNWRELLENTGTSYSLLYMRNTLIEAQERYYVKNPLFDEGDGLFDKLRSRVRSLFRKYQEKEDSQEER